MKKIRRMYPVILIAGFLFLAIMPGAACAADKHPCSEDIAKFCQGIRFGTPAMINCLETHEAQLSPACKEYETKLEGKRGERMEQVRAYAKFRQACKTDYIRFCRDVDPKQGGVMKCLKGHASEISDTCKESIKMIDVEK